MINIFGKIFGKSEVAVLHQTKAGAPADRQLSVAVAMLLLEMSGRDEDYAPQEVGTILRALANEYKVDKDPMLEIVSEADRERKVKEKVNQAVRLINDSYNDSQKITIISLLWKVLISDGKIEKSESNYIEQIRNRFHLTDSQIEQGKRQALQSGED